MARGRRTGGRKGWGSPPAEGLGALFAAACLLLGGLALAVRWGDPAAETSRPAEGVPAREPTPAPPAEYLEVSRPASQALEAPRATTREVEPRVPDPPQPARLAVKIAGLGDPGPWLLHLESDGRELARTVADSSQCELELEPGAWRTSAAGSGWRSEVATLTLSPGERGALELVPRALALVTGRLVGPDGSGVADLPVSLETPSGERTTATTALDGTFRIPAVPEGVHTLALGAAEEPFLEPRQVQVLPPATHLDEISLASLGALRVQVVAADGLPVPQARIVCRGDPRGLAEGFTDPDGIAEIPGLPPGHLRLFATHPELGRANLPLLLKAGELANVELRLRTRDDAVR